MKLKELFVPVRSLEADEARRLLQERPEGTITILDVRQPAEYEQEHIPGAHLVPLPRLADCLDELDTEKPTIVYCAVGGRSRVAAQLLSGKGFGEVYNLKGGIKAWKGEKAFGPREFHMTFVTRDEPPEQMIWLAYHMEAATQALYGALQQRAGDTGVADLLKELADIEGGHRDRVLDLCRELGFVQPPQDDFHESHEEFIEGGFDRDVFLRENEPHLSGPRDVLDLAMMIETQGLDLYLRLAEEISDSRIQALLFSLAEEEKKHLSDLGRHLERK